MRHSHHIVLLTTFCALSVGCSNQPIATPLHELSQVLEQVSQTPSQTEVLCAKIIPEEAKGECILIGVDNMGKSDLQMTTSLCASLKGAAHGECWFRLAERHDNPEFCKLAEPFDFDCTLHLLSRWLFRHPNSTWNEMVSKSELYGVDPTSKEGETVLYRHMVSILQPMQLQVCASLPKPEHCKRAATSIYRDRLRFAENQGTFPCTMDNNHPLAHSNQAPLHLIYTEFYNANCSD